MTISEQTSPISLSLKGTEGIKTGRWGRMRPFSLERMAPCLNQCPGLIHIPRFIQHIQGDDLEGAWRIILEENPLPRITGRVCFHPCETRCNRGGYDETVAINALERFVGDWAFEKGLDPIDQGSPKSKKVAVIGTGPAGIGCAYHLLRLGYRVSLFEAMKEIGGLLRYGIPEYRLPKRVLFEELERVLGSRAEITTGVRVGKDLSWEELLVEYQGVFLGIGAQRPIRFGIEGEEKGGQLDGLHFLRSPLEQVPFDPGQRVLIIGGGNTALDVARTVLRLKGRPVILYRRTREEMPAFEDEIRKAEEEGIEIRFLISPKAILREGERVKGLECIQNRSTALDSDGRRGFIPIDGSELFLEGDLIVTALGQLAELEGLPPEVKIEDKALVVAEDGSCGPRGIYAGGDVTPMPRSVIHALASGKRAALAIDQHIKKGGAEGTRREKAPQPQEIPLVGLEEINLAYFDKAARQKPPVEPPKTRLQGFSEVTGTLSLETLRREASRCFGCGNCNTCGNCYFFCPDFVFHLDNKTMKVAIDYDYCKGCCICVEECPRGALSAEVKG